MNSIVVGAVQWFSGKDSKTRLDLLDRRKSMRGEVGEGPKLGGKGKTDQGVGKQKTGR